MTTPRKPQNWRIVADCQLRLEHAQDLLAAQTKEINKHSEKARTWRLWALYFAGPTGFLLGALAHAAIAAI